MSLRRFADPRSAMAAYVIKGVRASGGVARDDQTFAGDFRDEIVSGILQLFGASDA